MSLQYLQIILVVIIENKNVHIIHTDNFIAHRIFQDNYYMLRCKK